MDIVVIITIPEEVEKQQDTSHTCSSVKCILHCFFNYSSKLNFILHLLHFLSNFKYITFQVPTFVLQFVAHVKVQL